MTTDQYEECREIVRALANKYGQSRIPVQREDLELVGWEYAARALADFEEGIGSRTAYVVQRIRWGIVDYLRTHWYSRSGVGGHQCEPVVFGEGEHLMLPPTEFTDPANHMDIEIMLNALPARSREIMHRIYFLDEKGTDIAASLNISNARLSYIKTESLAAMERWLCA
jgi:RNA polymerase sigma factor (sigma-70 family)